MTACPSCSFSILDHACVPPSPHPDLLVSGMPSESEAAAIQLSIDIADQSLFAIEEETDRLNRALNELPSRHKALRDFRLKQQSALSSLRKFPPEVWARVFLRAGLVGDGAVELRNDPRWIFTRVCGTWRAIAKSTPRLWEQIVLLPSSIHSTTKRCVLLLLAQQLQFSGSRPLFLRWEWDDTAECSGDRKFTRTILNLFLSVADRWEDASFGVDADANRRISHFSGSFPRLKRLEFTQFAHVPPSSMGDVFMIGAPLLQHLSLSTSPCLHELKFPWAQLTSCHISTTGVPSILIQASIFVLAHPYPGQPGPPETTSAMLRDLTVSGKDAHRALDHLQAPSLRRLVVDCCEDAGPSLLQFFSKSDYPFLTELTLKQSVRDDVLLDILALTPNVTHLLVQGEHITISDETIRTFGQRHGSGLDAHVHNLVPGLASLSLSGNFTCNNDGLLSMLRGRMSDGALRSVRLIPIDGSFMIPFVDPLRIADGLDVCVE
ncbi:F-box domain-containing protein [Mycena sanguinolenta]|uniref:F-box domain-containing protein n=1 Tax=Mycena sanguinolenta TaxID=230812 RepID=A0A8H6Z8B5_9AGAR|nr:F-box domain-containing protein [Mycena sanguinolenta]